MTHATDRKDALLKAVAKEIATARQMPSAREAFSMSEDELLGVMTAKEDESIRLAK